MSVVGCITLYANVFVPKLITGTLFSIIIIKILLVVSSR